MPSLSPHLGYLVLYSLPSVLVTMDRSRLKWLIIMTRFRPKNLKQVPFGGIDDENNNA